jgi:hypothetical protein
MSVNLREGVELLQFIGELESLVSIRKSANLIKLAKLKQNFFGLQVLSRWFVELRLETPFPVSDIIRLCSLWLFGIGAADHVHSI